MFRDSKTQSRKLSTRMRINFQIGVRQLLINNDDVRMTQVTLRKATLVCQSSAMGTRPTNLAELG